MSEETVERTGTCCAMLSEADVKKMSNGELANILAKHGEAATAMLMRDTGYMFHEAAERLRKFTPQGDSVEFKQKEVEDLMQVMGNGLQAMVVMKTTLGLAKDALAKMRNVVKDWCYEECTNPNCLPDDGPFKPCMSCGRAELRDAVMCCDNVTAMIVKMEEEEAKAGEAATLAEGADK